MNTKHTVEIFSAGCQVCKDFVARIKKMACPSCEVIVLDMKEVEVSNRAKGLNIRSIPSVVIDGRLADCCAGRGPDEDGLRTALLG
ncbi:MAG: thioredoxin family protein [Nitrospirota bacterium]|nr:thioredoxin family protein [Nitrospirota bacterium]